MSSFGILNRLAEKAVKRIEHPIAFVKSNGLYIRLTKC
jgi:hypothetical protein